MHYNTRNHPTTVMFEMDTHVIAAINGGRAGFGLDIALGCDLRIVADEARIATGFAKRGVVPESGGTWYLPRLLGRAKAAEVGFLGRTLTGAEASDMGCRDARAQLRRSLRNLYANRIEPVRLET